jgi:hypothetical protein
MLINSEATYQQNQQNILAGYLTFLLYQTVRKKTVQQIKAACLILIIQLLYTPNVQI